MERFDEESFNKFFDNIIFSFYFEKKIRNCCILVAIKEEENIFRYYKIKDDICIYEKADNNLQMLKVCEVINQTIYYNVNEHSELELKDYSIICSPVKKIITFTPLDMLLLLVKTNS